MRRLQIWKLAIVPFGTKLCFHAKIEQIGGFSYATTCMVFLQFNSFVLRFISWNVPAFFKDPVPEDTLVENDYKPFVDISFQAKIFRKLSKITKTFP